jgi:hypothetical protein
MLQVLNPYRSSVKLNSTVLSAVPGLMSSSNQEDILQCFMLVFLKLLLSGGYFCTVKIRDILEN